MPVGVYYGKWWTPGLNPEKVYGRLEIHTDETAVLESFGHLLTPDLSTAHHTVLHGEVGNYGTKVTFLGLSAFHEIPSAEDREAIQTLSPSILLWGDHLLSDSLYVGATCRFHGLLAWATSATLQAPLQERELSARIVDGEVHYRESVLTTTASTERSTSIREALEFVPDEDLIFSDLWERSLRPMQIMLMFAMRTSNGAVLDLELTPKRFCHATGCTGRYQEAICLQEDEDETFDAGEAHAATVLVIGMGREPQVAPSHGLTCLLPLDRHTFDILVPAWYELWGRAAKSLESLVQVQFADGAVLVAHRLADVTTTLEGIHNSLAEQPSGRVSPAEKSRRRKVKRGIPREHKAWFQGRLDASFSGLSYAQRLRALYDRVQWVGAHYAIDVDWWVRTTKDYRNTTAHSLERETRDLSVQAVIKAGNLVATAYLLNELGLNPGEARRAMCYTFDRDFYRQAIALGRTDEGR